MNSTGSPKNGAGPEGPCYARGPIACLSLGKLNLGIWYSHVNCFTQSSNTLFAARFVHGTWTIRPRLTPDVGPTPHIADPGRFCDRDLI